MHIYTVRNVRLPSYLLSALLRHSIINTEMTQFIRKHLDERNRKSIRLMKELHQK